MAYPSLLLVHGAATGAWVWDLWRRELKALGWEVNVLDLRGHGRSLPIDFSIVTMDDYGNDLESVGGQIAAAQGQHPVVGGWGMGGLVALSYAAKTEPVPALLMLSPSLPLEVAGRGDPELVRATPPAPVGPEQYGVYPDDIEASRAALFDLTEAEAERVLASSAGAQESGFAQRQRDRGISVPAGALRAPSLVVYGELETEPRPELSRRLAVHLAGASLGVVDAGHWGLVQSESAVAAAAPGVDAWLRRVLG